MKRTLGDTWWAELRWRVALQFVLWGAKIAPAGDAKAAMIEAYLAWIYGYTETRTRQVTISPSPLLGRKENGSN